MLWDREMVFPIGLQRVLTWATTCGLYLNSSLLSSVDSEERTLEFSFPLSYFPLPWPFRPIAPIVFFHWCSETDTLLATASDRECGKLYPILFRAISLFSFLLLTIPPVFISWLSKSLSCSSHRSYCEQLAFKITPDRGPAYVPPPPIPYHPFSPSFTFHPRLHCFLFATIVLILPWNHHCLPLLIQDLPPRKVTVFSSFVLQIFLFPVHSTPPSPSLFQPCSPSHQFDSPWIPYLHRREQKFLNHLPAVQITCQSTSKIPWEHSGGGSIEPEKLTIPLILITWHPRIYCFHTHLNPWHIPQAPLLRLHHLVHQNRKSWHLWNFCVLHILRIPRAQRPQETQFLVLKAPPFKNPILQKCPHWLK